MSHTIFRQWIFDRSHDAVAKWTALVERAHAAGVVLVWDDGRGQCPWYDARRCPGERALYLACAAALGAEATEISGPGFSRGGWVPPRDEPEGTR